MVGVTAATWKIISHTTLLYIYKKFSLNVECKLKLRDAETCIVERKMRQNQEHNDKSRRLQIILHQSQFKV